MCLAVVHAGVFWVVKGTRDTHDWPTGHTLNAVPTAQAAAPMTVFGKV